MTRGNQREIDRERAQKRNSDKNNVGNVDWSKKKESYADVMREKQRIHDEITKNGGG